jgi:hypothetical protein
MYVNTSKEVGRMSEEMRTEDIYPLQEAVLVRLQSMNDPQLSVAKLCGGTALSRCWLGHRVSFDLDFFLPEGFKAGELAVAMKKTGIDFRTKDIVDDLKRANQLHGYILREGMLLKVSFVEDAYFTLFPAVERSFGGAGSNGRDPRSVSQETQNGRRTWFGRRFV